MHEYPIMYFDHQIICQNKEKGEIHYGSIECGF